MVKAVDSLSANPKSKERERESTPRTSYVTATGLESYLLKRSGNIPMFVGCVTWVVIRVNLVLFICEDALDESRCSVDENVKFPSTCHA